MIEAALTAAKEAVQKVVEAAVETIGKELQDLPEQLGGLSKNDGIPKEIGTDTKTDGIPEEIGSKETDDFPEEIGSKETDTSESEGLTEERRAEIKEKTGWSDEVLDNIKSMEEAEIYLKAGLMEAEIGGKKCLIRSDIDWDQKDEKGRTNSERIQRGLAPLDQEGNAIELHHIGQHTDSPLAELAHEEHRCNGNDTILHDKSIESEVHGEGNNWNNERQDYWKGRSEYNEGGNE